MWCISAEKGRVRKGIHAHLVPHLDLKNASFVLNRCTARHVVLSREQQARATAVEVVEPSTAVQANYELMQQHMQADGMTQTLHPREDDWRPLCYEVEVTQHSIGSFKVVSGQ